MGAVCEAVFLIGSDRFSDLKGEIGSGVIVHGAISFPIFFVLALTVKLYPIALVFMQFFLKKSKKKRKKTMCKMYKFFFGVLCKSTKSQKLGFSRKLSLD
jgi:hypothetical protein